MNKKTRIIILSVSGVLLAGAVGSLLIPEGGASMPKPIPAASFARHQTGRHVSTPPAPTGGPVSISRDGTHIRTERDHSVRHPVAPPPHPPALDIRQAEHNAVPGGASAHHISGQKPKALGSDNSDNIVHVDMQRHTDNQAPHGPVHPQNTQGSQSDGGDSSAKAARSSSVVKGVYYGADNPRALNTNVNNPLFPKQMREALEKTIEEITRVKIEEFKKRWAEEHKNDGRAAKNAPSVADGKKTREELLKAQKEAERKRIAAIVPPSVVMVSRVDVVSGKAIIYDKNGDSITTGSKIFGGKVVKIGRRSFVVKNSVTGKKYVVRYLVDFGGDPVTVDPSDVDAMGGEQDGGEGGASE